MSRKKVPNIEFFIENSIDKFQIMNYNKLTRFQIRHLGGEKMVQAPYYPNLVCEMARCGIRPQYVAETIGISYRAFHNKISGDSDFTWPEVNVIQKKFFPNLTKDYLFATDDQSA